MSFHNNKKIPIWHLFFINLDLLPISKRKTNYLIFFFNKQYSIINNGNEIPSILHPKTVKSLSNIIFTGKDTEKFIQNLDSNKVHEHNMISIRMLKICGKSIIKSFPRKFYIGRNNNKVDSIETGRIVVSDLLLHSCLLP